MHMDLLLRRGEGYKYEYLSNYIATLDLLQIIGIYERKKKLLVTQQKHKLKNK